MCILQRHLTNAAYHTKNALNHFLKYPMKNRLPFLLVVVLCFTTGFSFAGKLINGAEIVRPGKFSAIPDFIRFNSEANVTPENFEQWLSSQFPMPEGMGFKLLSKESDNLGFTHYRLQQLINNMPVVNTMYILHVKNGKVQSVNGQILTGVAFENATAALTETNALSVALAYVGAKQYKWQVSGAESLLKQATGNTNATYFPKGELVYVSDGGKLSSSLFHLAYRFDVYAQQPLSRQYVYIDAANGNVVYTQNRLESSDVTTTATTQYSGHRTITTDSYNGTYRLRESGRGGGIVTLNAQTSTNTNTAVDFTDATNAWATTNAALDQYAPDAHLASEATYDFYNTTYGRNSIDGNGLQLVAFVHYDSQLDNAFWDGQSMNYGDGSTQFGTKPYTALEVGGHEITHGLTQYTANLNYQDESGALNESFSDCMGTAIRQSILQAASVDYLIGDELGQAFRSMRSPKTYQQPNTYLGTYWATGFADNGGVHTNSGVQNYWFYLVAHGGSGTNDNNKFYNIPGITLDKASAITYRNLTVYLTPASVYADARTYSIEAATDLYGACSPEVATVTNAWYAVGVGDTFTAGVVANFSSNITSSCSAPATIDFTNTSINGATYMWDFGDGIFSATTRPSHTYNGYGTFTVSLLATSSCGTDSVIKTGYITINNNEPSVTNSAICSGQSTTLSANSPNGDIVWYGDATSTTSIGTGNTFSTPTLSSTTTYYAETQIASPVDSCGPADNNFGTGSYFTNTNGHALIFNCTAEQTLLTVDVFAQSAGNRTILLQDSNSNTIHTATVNIPAGASTVTLNFDLPVEDNMMLYISGTNNLYRNRTGAHYPYTSTDGSIVITNSDAGSDIYYFFYNWKLQPAPCVSGRVPVVAEVLNAGGGSFSYSGSGTTVTFTPSVTGLSSYHWDFGDGTSSTDANPTHTYSSNATFTVTLTESNGSCNGSASQNVNIAALGVKDLSNINDISLYPNPTNSKLNINIANNSLAGKWNMAVNNLLGEKVSTSELNLENGTNTLSLDVNSYASGIYFITFNNGAQSTTRKFVKE